MKNSSKNRINRIDEVTLCTLFNNHCDEITLFLNYYTHDQSLIEDIIQDIFVKLWEERETLSITYIKTYLYNAARNRMLNHLRNEQQRTNLLTQWIRQEAHNELAEECIDREEFERVYHEAVALLPEKCRALFILSRVEHKSYRAIAEETALSIKTVEAQISIALRKIKNHLISYYNR